MKKASIAFRFAVVFVSVFALLLAACNNSGGQAPAAGGEDSGSTPAPAASAETEHVDEPAVQAAPEVAAV